MNKDEIIKKLQIKNGKLQVQIERLKLDKEEYYLDYLDLQQRIDKAIEYIERNCLEFNVKYACQGLNNDKVDVLLDILRGKNNE
jgi:hypothetical protein